jgi:hypothetical protein
LHQHSGEKIPADKLQAYFAEAGTTLVERLTTVARVAKPGISANNFQTHLPNLRNYRWNF